MNRILGRKGLLLALAVSLGGCAQIQTRSEVPESENPQSYELSREVEENSSTELVKTPTYSSRFGQIDLVVNSQVKKWLNYFQGRGRRHMKRYLERSSRYLPMMKGVLRENGLPEDLVYIALIESGFSPMAYSHASAVGYWQFIRDTGRRYGLKINAYVDERRDPVLSTHAAAQYFKALYNLFGSWPLAMASYNAGENRVKRMVMRYYTRDFWELARRRKLPRETRNYVPKFIAAAIIGKNPKQFGFTDVDFQPQLSYETISLRNPVSLKAFAKNLGVPHKQVQLLNPKFVGDYVPLFGQGTVLRVPEGMKEKGIVAAANSKMARPTKYASGRGYFWYRVRRGDNLSYLAQKYKTRISTIRRMNRLGRRSMIRIGQRLKIPDRRYGSRTARSTQRRSRSVSSDGYHTVRRGENLSLIAQKYGTTVSKLKRWNRLGRRSLIRAGQKLKVRDSSVGSNDSSANVRTQYHVVRRGENLSVIAQKYGTSVSALKRLNRLGRRSLIQVGQKLRLPGGSSKTVHVVRRGETLGLIARKYQVSMNQIVRANDLNNKARIYAGSRLVIPQ